MSYFEGNMSAQVKLLAEVDKWQGARFQFNQFLQYRVADCLTYPVCLLQSIGAVPMFETPTPKEPSGPRKLAEQIGLMHHFADFDELGVTNDIQFGDWVITDGGRVHHNAIMLHERLTHCLQPDGVGEASLTNRTRVLNVLRLL